MPGKHQYRLGADADARQRRGLAVPPCGGRVPWGTARGRSGPQLPLPPGTHGRSRSRTAAPAPLPRLFGDAGSRRLRQAALLSPRVLQPPPH